MTNHDDDFTPLAVCDERAAKLFLFAVVAIPTLLAIAWLLS